LSLHRNIDKSCADGDSLSLFCSIITHYLYKTQQLRACICQHYKTSIDRVNCKSCCRFVIQFYKRGQGNVSSHYTGRGDYKSWILRYI